MHPGVRARGWLRRAYLVLSDENWREFREYLARDRVSMEAMLSRLIEEHYLKPCREHYRKISEAES